MNRSRLFTTVVFAGLLGLGSAGFAQCGYGGGGMPPPTTTTTTSTSTSTTTTSMPIIDPILCTAGGTSPGSCSLTAPGVVGSVQTSGTGTFAVDDFSVVPPAIVVSGTGPATQGFVTIPGHEYTLFAQSLTTMTLH